MGDLSRLKDSVRPFLRQFLQNHGVKINKSGLFKCINPEHHDSDPSMHLLPPEEDRAWCFGCEALIDIFTANHFLTGAPLYGREFVTGNLLPLLEEFGIPHDLSDISEEELWKEQLRAVYTAAADLLASDRPFVDRTYGNTRGWSEDTCKQFGAATVKDFAEFVTTLSKTTMVPEDELEKRFGIEPRLFSHDRFTFTVKDHRGLVSHFVARKIPQNGGTRFESSHGGLMLYPDALNGLHIAKRYIGRKLYVFEGFGDLLTAHQHGIKCSCAMGGLRFKKDHLYLLQELGFSTVCFALDQDAAGRSKMEKLVEKYGSFKGLNVTVVHMDLTSSEMANHSTNDPDYYIRTRGAKKFLALEPKTALDYQIEKYLDEKDYVDPASFLQKVVPFLLNIKNLVKRGMQIKKLAKLTNVSEQDIRDEVERLERAEISDIVSKLGRSLPKVSNADELSSLLDEVKLTLSTTAVGREERELLSPEECVLNFKRIMSSLENRGTGIHGWKTGFKTLDLYTDGIPKPINGGSLLALAGPPHHGKSALLLAIAFNVARLNPDATVLYWAIDDARRDVYPRILSAVTGIPLAEVRRIAPFSDPTAVERLRQAEEEILELIETGRFQVKDDEVGRHKAIAEKWIAEAQKRFDRPILLAIDSFHNILAGGRMDSQDERTKAKALSIWLKSASRKQNFTVLCTMELNKSGFDRPTMATINETGKLVYDWDTIALIYNPFLASNRDPSAPHWNKQGRDMPLIECNIQKNKLGQRGIIWFRLDEDTTAVAESEDAPVQKYSSVQAMEQLSNMLDGLD